MCSKAAVSDMQTLFHFKFLFQDFFVPERLISEKRGAVYTTLRVPRGTSFSITSLIAELSFC